VQHVAIDLGGRESQICVREGDGTIVAEDRWPTRSLKKYLSRLPKSRVVLETCSEAFAVADGALELGHEVRVVPSTLVRALGVGARGIKTDVRDARTLSEASCRMASLPSVHVPSAEARERKTRCGMREALVGVRTKLVNTVRGWLRTQASGLLPRATVETFPKRVRERLKTQGLAIPTFVERQLSTITHLNEQIRASDAELEEVAAADPVCRRLMTTPGVGPVTAVRFLAAIDRRERFSDAHALASYLGLAPGEDSSSDRKRITSITKAGATALRSCLVQASWSIRRLRPNDPMAIWARAIEERRGKKIAVVALARKLAGILYAIWRDGSVYQPIRATTAQTAALASV
jgi:transposase